ncbi:MTA/SAH nucleosidase [Actinomyces graevenitzii F0530]|uniref:adenosylhomocysteine nucleosidase n=2 Tax=Actinomyces graevenitzii TaxID=55565 RepID=U1RNI9_9ACTO|nr:MTA/SAH nucleosidase [Actinomyces graevenitzii F0530]
MDEELAPFLAATEPAKIDQVGMEQLQLGHAAVYARVLSPAVSATEGSAEAAGGSAEAAGAESAPSQTPDAEGYPVLLVRSKIGGTNATAALTSVISLVSKQPRLVVSAGTAGGLKSGIAVGDVCVSTTLAYTDADATAFGYVRGQLPGMPATYSSDDVARDMALAASPALNAATPTSANAKIYSGQMLAGNSFVTAANVGDTRTAFPEAISTDMESTPLAQVCEAYSLPFISVRGVSDLCGPEAGEDFHIGVDEAAARSAAVVTQLVRSYLK